MVNGDPHLFFNYPSSFAFVIFDILAYLEGADVELLCQFLKLICFTSTFKEDHNKHSFYFV